MSQICGGFIRCLQELEQSLVWRLRLADVVVWQDELAEIPTVKRCGRLDGRFREAGWLRVSIGVEGGIRNRAPAGPESTATDFVRVGFSRDSVGQVRDPAGVLWCSST